MCMQSYKAAMAGIVAAGLLVSLLAVIVGTITNCKQISDTLIEGRTYVRFKDHTNKIGYQHAVSLACCFDVLALAPLKVA